MTNSDVSEGLKGQNLPKQELDGEVLGVLTGQVPIQIRTTNHCDCPGDETMAHVRGCRLHPESD